MLHRDRGCFIFIAAQKTIQCYLVRGGLISVTACVCLSLSPSSSRLVRQYTSLRLKGWILSAWSFWRFYVETHTDMKGTPLSFPYYYTPPHKPAPDVRRKFKRWRVLYEWLKWSANKPAYLQIVGAAANRPNFYLQQATSCCVRGERCSLCPLTCAL